MVKYEVICEDWYSAESLEDLAREVENGLLDDMGQAKKMEFAGDHYTAHISIIEEQLMDSYHNEIRQSIISSLQSQEENEKEIDECQSVVILDDTGKPAVYDVFGVKTHGKNISLHIADRVEGDTMWMNIEHIDYGAEKVLEHLYKILNSN